METRTPAAQAGLAPDLPMLAACPLCHTAAATMAGDAMAEGADWLCGRCGQRWNASRLAATAGYAAWASRHDGPRRGGS